MLVVIVAIIIDFIEFHPRKNEKKKKKSIVETGSMFLFFFIYSNLIRFGIGNFEIKNVNLRLIMLIFGTFLIVFGAYFNVKGRFNLGKNWSNQIKIYKDHTLVTSGLYSIVRHPLYASLIWMFYGGSLAYSNYMCFLINTFVFVPFMYYRAKQEEKLLKEEFKNYKEYQNNVGMFFPNLNKIFYKR